MTRVFKFQSMFTWKQGRLNFSALTEWGIGWDNSIDAKGIEKTRIRTKDFIAFVEKLKGFIQIEYISCFKQQLEISVS